MKTEVLKKTNTKKFVAWIVVVAIVSSVVAFFGCLNSSSVALSIHSDAIKDGKNPDGSPFDIYEVLDDEVLLKASEKLEGRIGVETLKKHLSVSDNTSLENYNITKENIRAGADDYTSYPSNYTLTYSIVSEDIKNEGILASVGAVFSQLAMPSKSDILTAVSESYKEYYSEKYVMNTVLIKADWTKSDLLDYYNQAESVKDTAYRLSRYLQIKYQNNSDFVSQSEKVGYGDINLMLTEIMNVDIENYKSFIIQNALAMDKAELLNQFEYMKQLNIETNVRKTNEYEINKHAIEIYDPDVTRVVFIPALDTDKSFYMNRTKVGVDYLVEQASQTKLAADDAKHNVEYYDYLIGKFNASNASDDVHAEAAEMYENIKLKIEQLSELAVRIANEEAESEGHETLEIGKVNGGFGIMPMAIGFVKMFVMLMIVSFLAVSIIEFLKKKSR